MLATLGLDPGASNCGVVVIAGGPSPESVVLLHEATYAVYNPRGGDMLCQLYKWFVEVGRPLIEFHGVTLVGIERQFHHPHTLIGAMLGAFFIAMPRVRVVATHPRTWRALIRVPPKARGKAPVVAALKALFPAITPRTQHTWDALAVAYTCVQTPAEVEWEDGRTPVD